MEKLDVLKNTWHIIFNSNANEKRNGRLQESIGKLLQSKNIPHEFHTVKKPGEGISTTKFLCDNGVKHLVAAGGDGTVNEVVNGIFKSSANPKDIFLAILPLGHGNDFVRTHNYPQKIEDNINLWLSGKFMAHDVGSVTSITPDSVKEHRHFINIAGFGFDADVIYDVTYNRPRLKIISVYVVSLLKTLFHHKPTYIEVQSNGGTSFKGEVFMVIAAIGKYNGGGICEAKYAIPDDGKIDLIIVPKISIPTVICHLKDMFTGDHIDKIKSISKTLATEINITSPTLFRAEVEGELLAPGNYQISILPNALNVLTNL